MSVCIFAVHRNATHHPVQMPYEHRWKSAHVLFCEYFNPPPTPIAHMKYLRGGDSKGERAREGDNRATREREQRVCREQSREVGGEGGTHRRRESQSARERHEAEKSESKKMAGC